jgi:sulfhydrogenase subunit beta (sulfur reductase)
MDTQEPGAAQAIDAVATDTVVIHRSDLGQLFDALARRGFRVIGPTVRDGAIVYDDLKSPHDLPVGWTDEQEAGTYRLKKRDDEALFGYVVGPHSWKKFLHPPVLRLWQARREGAGFQVVAEADEPQKMAFIGVRSCELHAIGIQDKVFLGGDYTDPAYKARRENLFVVAVNCGQAGGTCFCASMQTGPRATSGYDLALTEVIRPTRDEGRWTMGVGKALSSPPSSIVRRPSSDPSPTDAPSVAHYFVVEIGTEQGAEIMAEVPCRSANQEEQQEAERIVARTAEQMGRTLDTTGIKDLLYGSYENPRWDEVAERCLTCGNCTMACPTCFCTAVEDVTDLTGQVAERSRRWDSCFTMDFSYIHGGSIRATPKSRYRQWMTHKLATWYDQFGTSGCVGCGRCITWCPVGIDITEEARAIRESNAQTATTEREKKDATDA